MHEAISMLVDSRTLEELVDYRLIVEPRLAGRAALRRSDSALSRMEQVGDVDFHVLIAREAGNLLIEDNLSTTLSAMGRLSCCQHGGYGDPSAEEHRAVVTAIRFRDAQAASTAMATHLSNVLLRATH
ncbi:FadR family transcriptional regulator [Nocardioides humilatus]|uniref:FadR family transcriptional regulator n=1 Tax=Nocardioides humilatus TaxID=2607660 RepID=A0A5B1LMU7_9ACTN|nr:FCD domain-containing protein [Nocardioides humilatus]KAA1421834.1 FadR family transcriptional regulator [Nocardioides humilatus]